jgi:hypothetical protein
MAYCRVCFSNLAESSKTDLCPACMADPYRRMVGMRDYKRAARRVGEAILKLKELREQERLTGEQGE